MVATLGGWVWGYVPPYPSLTRKEKRKGNCDKKGDRPVWWRSPIAVIYLPAALSSSVVSLISPTKMPRTKSMSTLIHTHPGAHHHTTRGVPRKW